MPKMKTHRGAAKRFWKSGRGKLMRRRAFHSHLLADKSAKRKRRLKDAAPLAPGDSARMEKLLPYL